jgi:hypothetical protein
VDDWLHLARNRRAAAEALMSAKLPWSAWEQSGFAAEALLKAALMTAHQRPTWWTRKEWPDVWTHDLRALAQLIGVDITLPPTDPHAPAWKVVFDWRREHGYNTSPMPAVVAADMDEAIWGPNGAAEWITRTFRLAI